MVDASGHFAGLIPPYRLLAEPGEDLAREAATGVIIGLAIALIAGPLVLWRWGDADLALGVSLALFGACSVATVVAMALPLLLDRFGADPAFGSGPLATVIQDLLSILIYLGVVTAVVP